MDQTKAQRLLHKIQAFLDNGNGQELSRLEKDLIKSYILQLYDAVSFDSTSTTPDVLKHHESHDYRKPHEEVIAKKETPVFKTPEVVKEEVYTPEPLKEIFQKPEPPKEDIYYELPKADPVPAYKEYVVPVMKEQPIEIKPPVVENTSPVPPEHKPYQYQPPEPVIETVQVSAMSSTLNSDQQEILSKIFDQQKSDDIAHRFTHTPIPSIESAMGLNERIFTLNELFGGDKSLFDATCQKLNALHSLDEARQALMNGPARDFKWADAARVKMAEQFIRIVARRYQKT